jgi:hypothetical protein
MLKSIPRLRRSGRLGLFFSMLCLGSTAQAAEDALPLWDAAMLVIIFLTLSSSAALTLAAWRQWRGGWRLVAAFPIAALVLWCGWIIGSRSVDPAAHALWSFELFGWALLNLLYMVTALTAKRAFEKADSTSD